MRKLDELSVWIENYKIHLYEADFYGNAALNSILNYFQDSAANHYHAIEQVSGEILKPTQTWFLSRMEVQVNWFPIWKDQITVKTWSRGIDKFFALRDFIVIDKDENILIKATSSWLIIDIQTRKIIKPGDFSSKWPYRTQETAIGYNAGKINELINPIPCTKFTVHYSDCDVNQHVNNVKYTEWIMAGYDLSIVSKYKPGSLQINFLNEAVTGDEVMVYQQEIDDKQYLNQIIRKSDNKEICRAAITWIIKS